ncbi:hypothetical protein Vafri_4498 [Volvox africanus]|uniref:Uncharacterized protein n=1 Tax=Volvox africanus TaxID=51714 RepID=A0A8J4EV13_9CHLO|nr:hypothetical protein Vafri_4498 [Volvox africanus]
MYYNTASTGRVLILSLSNPDPYHVPPLAYGSLLDQHGWLNVKASRFYPHPSVLLSVPQTHLFLGGRDHFVFMPGDRASCHSDRWLQDEIIKVVHFGMQKKNLTWLGIENKDYGCIQTKRDLVVPSRSVNTGPLLPNTTTSYYQVSQG